MSDAVPIQHEVTHDDVYHASCDLETCSFMRIIAATEALAEAVSAFRDATVRASQGARVFPEHLNYPEYREMAYASDMYKQAKRG